jgi:hypothetical protein
VALIDLFSIHPATGKLTFVRREKGDARHQILNEGLQAPLVLPDLVVVGGRSTAPEREGKPVLVVYRIDPAAGTLTAAGAVVELRGATSGVSFLFAVE